MARINTNVSSLIAQHRLSEANKDLTVRLQRLSTGLKINRGADGPADLIVSERLRSEIEGISQAINNSERATNVIATAEAALAEVANLLTTIKSLAVEAANSGGLSKEEIQANQLQVDDAVASITRISDTTTFAGLSLLNGSLDYVTSGVPTSALTDVRIFQATFGTNATAPVAVEVISSAQRASLFLSTGSAALTSSVSIEVAGNRGVQVLQFVSNTGLSAVQFAINQVTDSTGVYASVVNGSFTSGISVYSSDFGSSQFVSVEKLSTPPGTFFDTYSAKGVTGALQRDTGEDVLALVNGTLALGDGKTVKLNTNTLNLELALSDAYAQTTGVRTFSITGGGAKFQLGPSVQTSQQISFGIQSIASPQLGGSELGFLSSIVSGGPNSLVAGEAAAASNIIDAAINQVSVTRGRLGAFELNTLQTNIRSLQISLENVTASESQIRDTDFAAEISELTRAQVLVNVGTSVLATANSSTQSVLALLQ
ncbi:MAG: flagellin [Planctomycetaceae bacterium]|nr:flagellin [Planctomycetaceae bacterium]